MRYMFFRINFCLLILMASLGATSVNAQKQMDNYPSQWKKVEEFQKKGLTKSALIEVDKIYSLAKKSKNDPQIIKTLLFKMTLQQNIEENASENSIIKFEEEISGQTGAAKSILQSITAQMYWNYFQENRYRFYSRTNTVNFDKKDIATWTIDDLHNKISALYLASLNEEALLKNTLLNTYDPIILKGNVRYLRPTLFDLLAHRALDYFKNDERNITRPSYAFEINDPKAFAPVNEFIHHKFETKDSASLHQKALVIFQKILAFHEKDKVADALIDADIERLEFVNQYGIMEDKDSLFMAALKSIGTKFEKNPRSAQASFLLAQTIYNKALENHNNNMTSTVYTIKKAKEILNTLVTKFPKSEGGINAQNLINQIIHPELSLTTEKVNVPGIPFRTLVNFQNTRQIYLRLLQLTPELKTYLRKNGENQRIFSRLVSQKNIRNWKQELPVTDDYLPHSTEIKIDALPVGEYVLLASADAAFSINKNPLAAQYFHVSNISYINSNNSYFVLDRTTGQPLAGSQVQLWNLHYDYKTRDYKLEKDQFLKADKNGFFKLQENKKSGESRSTVLEINYKQDHLFLDDQQDMYYYTWYQQNNDAGGFKNQVEFDKTNGRVFLFSDRSIYRPGQIVYFKGIGVTKHWQTQKTILLQSKDSVIVFLQDANGEVADSVKVSFNEFGSFNGKFKLPEGKMNGEFNIVIQNFPNSIISFSVEEYKRPKYYTEFEKVKGSFRVNDTVNITGFAKAYAGNNIDGAKVTYRVIRIARFIYPWIFRGKGFPRVQPMEIAHGEAITDAEGKFSIQFTAIPDRTVDPKTDPVFDYRVEADVTDINGETRSGEIIVPIGYKALNLQINFPKGDVINADSLKNISISSKNLSGEFEPVNAEIKIYALQTPERLIRARLWEEPDQFILDKKEYIQYFPHDEYKDETKKETWEKGALILEKSDRIFAHYQLTIDSLRSMKQGWYVVEITAKDKDGQDVKDVKYFQVFDPKSNSLPAPSYTWNYTEKSKVEPGEAAKILIGSSAENVFLIQEINKIKTNIPKDQEQEKPSLEIKFISLNKNKKTFDFKISEGDRGGFGVTDFFVKDNRFYASGHTINVPWSNKDLNISFDTWRDKTLPGSEEKWTVKITGNKGEKVGAEMLASMYDASLDQFRSHSWNDLSSIWPTYNGYNSWQGRQNFTTVVSIEKYWNVPFISTPEKRYDALNYLPNPYILFGGGIVRMQNRMEVSASQDMMAAPAPAPLEEVVLATSNKSLTSTIVTIEGNPDVGVISPPVEKIDQSQIQIRKNFNETAFFFPELRTDKEGNIQFSFTMPEALTKWKLMTLAHTKELASGYAEKTVITQKELMVQPNAPRFLREGDKMEFSAKIVNLGEKEVSGQAELHLLNATTMNPVDSWFKNSNGPKTFTVSAGQSGEVNFRINIPTNFNEAVVYRIVAKAGNVSDGEEAAIPVITNRMLVTESLPLHMRGDGTKNYRFEKLQNSGKSSSLTNYGVTVEYTTNPAWYAVQAIPYLMEYPYECSEQNFNRFYANALAVKIANSSPKIKAIFERWRTSDTSALMSNLQKNEELKSVLLEETPWVMQAKSEAEQKKNIALLFDMVKMSQQLDASLDKLINMQAPNGGFVWFKGGPDDRYVTQYIVTGIGHLKQLNAFPEAQKMKLNAILEKAIPYLDSRLKEDYDQLLKHKANLKENQLSNIAIQYLYMRSFFPDHKIPAATQKAYTYYREQAQKFWLAQSKYMQGMIALSLNRTADQKTAKEIIQSLKENSINNEELGMYWKEWDRPGYWWYQAPIESQALMIEAFSEIDKDPKTIGDLKTWLLKNKQTTNWKTTKATAEAVYALLLQGTDWLSEERNVVINLGTTTFNSKDEKQDAGTGYFKRRIDGDKVTPDMGNITVSVKSEKASGTKDGNNNPASWGSVYWQYFEDLDKITFAETPLKLSKKLFIEKNTDRGPVLTPVNAGDNLNIGDKIKVRIELRVDRDMEYVHMKDMRASAMEPTNVISQYKWQGGLGYYETTKDVSTNFFFNYLPKGTYVFEYPMFVTHAGNFSNGITTIQSMYAPEFTAHSEGVRVEVVK